MTKRFAIGFGVGLLIFVTINLLAAHLASDCGLLAVFGRSSCFDGIVRFGWPLIFYQDGGFAYNHLFNGLYFLVNNGVGLAFAVLFGWLFSTGEKPLPK